MRIGIIGSDDRAQAIGRLLASGGHEITLSDPSDPGRAKEAAAQIGARTQIPYRQAITGELLFFAVSPQQVDQTLDALGSHPEATIVDAVDEEPKQGRMTGAEVLAHKLDSHQIVRALIVLPQAGANVPICGDDARSKELVDEAFRACGCVTTDRGPLSAAVELDPPAKTAAA